MTKFVEILVGVTLAAIVAGVLVAFLVYHWWERVQKRRQGIYSGKEQFNNAETVPSVSVTPADAGKVEPKLTEKEALEILVENHKKTLALENQRQSAVVDILPEAVSINQKISPIEEKPKEFAKIGELYQVSLHSEIIKELGTNFRITSTPWADKLLPFQTTSWDAAHGEDEPLLEPHLQELINLYVDIGLANHIVWMATELGYRSKELDESYTKLRVVIAERLQRLLSSLNMV